MMMLLLTFAIFAVTMLICAVPGHSLTQDEAKKKVESTLQETDKIMKTLFDRWQIQEYPSFLKAAFMTETSWELLKIKFQSKILKAIASNIPKDQTTDKNNKFVISFLGSSVTAGHDSMFSQSLSEMTRVFMKPAFDAAGIQFEVINGALGNNPCAPYDMCIKAFAGLDADIIQWEQSFNCFGSSDEHRLYFEQFVRQAMDMKSQPVIVFSSSDTPNWDKKVCDGNPKQSPMSDDDKNTLKLYDSGKNIKKVVEMQKGEQNSQFSAIMPMIHAYKMSGIQLWSHGGYEQYKCFGPYVPGWGCCSASWHPSILGHELRASHYSFIWLAIYKDALVYVLDHLSGTGSAANATAHSVDDLLVRTQKHIFHELKHTQLTALFPSDYSDGLQCLTAFHPLNDPNSDLRKHLINNKVDRPSFEIVIFEDLMDKGLIMGARARGYLDFKYTFYGNMDSKPLSIKINVQKEGNAFLCQPPGIWGKLPDHFKNFWDADTKIYLTKAISNYGTLQSLSINGTFISENPGNDVFDFKTESSKLMPYTNKKPKDSQNLCVMFNDKFPPGHHVLTIVPGTKESIMISTLLTT